MIFTKNKIRLLLISIAMLTAGVLACTVYFLDPSSSARFVASKQVEMLSSARIDESDFIRAGNQFVCEITAAAYVDLVVEPDSRSEYPDVIGYRSSDDDYTYIVRNNRRGDVFRIRLRRDEQGVCIIKVYRML